MIIKPDLHWKLKFIEKNDKIFIRVEDKLNPILIVDVMKRNDQAQESFQINKSIEAKTQRREAIVPNNILSGKKRSKR